MKFKSINTDIQDEIIERLKDIVCKNEESFTLYDVDNNIEIQNNIMALVPEIRQHFFVHNFRAVQNSGENMKRPYMSIVKHLLSSKYKIFTEDFRDVAHNARTKKYYLIKK